jgi:AcrR family transcriptional regulator
MPDPERTVKRRRPGRRPGANTTRLAIVEAAGRQFAVHGYDRTSLRAIAAEAGVDPKLVSHFFGSKQRLFVAAVGLPLNPAEILPAVIAGDPALLRRRIADTLTAILEQPELHQRLTGVVRAAASEPAVARMLGEFLSGEVFPSAEVALGGDDARLRLNLFGSQLVGLVVARFIAGVEPFAHTAPAIVADAVAGTLERYLRGPLS